MKKKLYIQPNTDLMTLQGRGLCQDMVVGSNQEPKDNVWGAPKRKINVLYI